MQSESGMVRARGRKVQTENHFRAAEPNGRWGGSVVQVIRQKSAQ